jgi:hypothetical protein
MLAYGVMRKGCLIFDYTLADIRELHGCVALGARMARTRTLRTQLEKIVEHLQGFLDGFEEVDEVV